MKKIILLKLLFALSIAQFSHAMSIADLKIMAQQQSQAEIQNKNLQGFSITSLDNTNITNNDLVGKPTILAFFTTWSPAGVNSTLNLSQFNTNNLNTFNIIGMNNEHIEASDLQNFITLNDISFPVAALINTNIHQFHQFKIKIIPTTYFFNKDGNLIDRYEGELTNKVLNSHL